MKPGGQILVAAASRLYAPLLAAAGLAVLIGMPAGGGVAVVAGLLFALAPFLHALTFGAEAARRAFPASLARVLMAAGLLAALASAPAPPGMIRDALAEGGVFVAAAGGAQLITTVLIGRAPTLPDEDW